MESNAFILLPSKETLDFCFPHASASCLIFCFCILIMLWLTPRNSPWRTCGQDLKNSNGVFVTMIMATESGRGKKDKGGIISDADEVIQVLNVFAGLSSCCFMFCSTNALRSNRCRNECCGTEDTERERERHAE